MENNNTKKIYKRWANIYDKFMGSKYINKQRELEISLLNIKKGDKVLFVGIGTGEDLKFNDNFFNIITVLAAFHHFSEPQQFIYEDARVLSTNGRLKYGCHR